MAELKTILKEISIIKPSAFTGDRRKIRGFIQECRGYLQLNKHIYDTDEAKIAFVLSFLTDKEALKWKEAYLASLYKPKTKTNAVGQEEEDEGEFEYPTFLGFINAFQGYFQPINQARTANHQLATIKQGKRTVEEFIADFQLLISMAGMTVTTDSDNLHLINYFQRGLNPAIAKKIALSDNVPTTVNGWAEKAMQYDTNYRLTMAMFGKPAYSKTSSEHWGRGNTSHQRDQYAMDVDAMTTEERTTLMKQGRCFLCRLFGHMARDCPKKGKKTPPPAKKNVQDIHAMLTGLTKEEKEELLALQTGEKQDF
jgi:hypothetical protein